MLDMSPVIGYQDASWFTVLFLSIYSYKDRIAVTLQEYPDGFFFFFFGFNFGSWHASATRLFLSNNSNGISIFFFSNKRETIMSKVIIGISF